MGRLREALPNGPKLRKAKAYVLCNVYGRCLWIAWKGVFSAMKLAIPRPIMLNLVPLGRTRRTWLYISLAISSCRLIYSLLQLLEQVMKILAWNLRFFDHHAFFSAAS